MHVAIWRPWFQNLVQLVVKVRKQHHKDAFTKMQIELNQTLCLRKGRMKAIYSQRIK